MGEAAIRTRALEKTFGAGETQVRAIRGVEMDVLEGEVILLMGPSGGGKTTLLSMIGAMLRPTSGSVTVNGVELTSLPESRLPDFRARRFGFVFQDFNLLSALSAQENVEFALNLSGVTGREARHRAAELLDAFGLTERRAFRPEKLSGGEKQRVAIARALANKPAVILADEPTANLDSKMGHEIARLLRHAASEEGRSVVIATHDARLKEVADRVLWIEDGELKTMSDMATDPVCGMAVDREGAPHYVHEGVTHYFCSVGCREEFAYDPQRILERNATAPSKVASLPCSG